MASAIIHICVAKKLNEKLKTNEKEFLLGSIAPDIAKIIGISKNDTHFITTGLQNIPNMESFIQKYQNDFHHAFTLGYLVHLYTDKFWFYGFIDQYCIGEDIKLLDGTRLMVSTEEAVRLIYNDYTNLNIQLLDEYDLDLSLFYEELPDIQTEIKEVPLDRMQELVDQMGIIVENSKEKKSYIFDIDRVKQFIDDTVERIYHRLIERNII